jgi:hypothetical protein
VVGPAEANGASSIPRNLKENLEEAEVDAKMMMGLHATIAGHFSFKGQRYRDGGGVSRPHCGWSKGVVNEAVVRDISPSKDSATGMEEGFPIPTGTG